MKDRIFIGVSRGHIILGLGRLRKERLERGLSVPGGQSQKFHYFNKWSKETTTNSDPNSMLLVVCIGVTMENSSPAFDNLA